MTYNELKIPFYARTTIFFVGMIAFFTMLYIAQSIIVPIVFAIIIAIVLHPLVNFLIRLHLNRIFAISISLLITILLIAGLGILLYSQGSKFSESWPALVDRFTQVFNQSIAWSSGYFNIDPKKIHDWITETQGEFINTSMLTENDQVFVKDGERCWFVKLGEVRLFESVGNYAKVFFGSYKPLILKSLNALEERLDEKIFFRANRKHIVNLRMIEKIEPYFNGGLLLELQGGEKIEVSRRQAVKFKEMMSL